jgi:hypothetical protein
MPGNVPVTGDIIQVRVTCSEGNQISQNVLHYLLTVTGGGGMTQLQIATAFQNVVSPTYRQMMPATAFFEGVRVQNLSPPMAVAAETNLHNAGTATGNGMPRQASALIRTHTEFAGKKNRGRVYVGLLSSVFLDPGGILNGAGFALVSNLATLIGPTVPLAFGGQTVNLALGVRHPNLPAPPGTPSLTLVSSVEPTAFLATQRRRGDFGRTNVP